MRAVALRACEWIEPAAALAGFADAPFALALLSGGGGPRARWSYLAKDPDAVFELQPGDDVDAFAVLRDLLGPQAACDPAGPPFQGGLAGLAAYELGARTEPVDLERALGWPDLVCARYLAVLAFDHEARRVFAIGRGATDAEADAQAQIAEGWIAPPAARAPTLIAQAFEPASPAEDYEQAVAEIVERIAAGEIFQANVARAWRGRLTQGARPYDLIARLVYDSPAPFAAYLRLEDRAVVSNSPERFIEVRPGEDGLIAETRPIKGTRPRGADAAQDRRLAAELSASAKDRAENLMIVDLMRNDLSRTCAPVETVELFQPEAFANVHHLVSTVRGRVMPGRSALDVFAAAFPPGSITGAPKVQAMKVIAELEPPRGPYCGSMFWAGFDGAFDSSVLIRTAVFEHDDLGWRVEARAGAGIVADSQPGEEARETEAKIAALARALTEEAS